MVVAAVIGAIYYLRRSRITAAGQCGPSSKRTAPSDPAILNALRQNLRLKVMYDEAKIDRLIDFERRRLPTAGEEDLMREAIERWERDNR